MGSAWSSTAEGTSILNETCSWAITEVPPLQHPPPARGHTCPRFRTGRPLGDMAAATTAAAAGELPRYPIHPLPTLPAATITVAGPREEGLEPTQAPRSVLLADRFPYRARRVRQRARTGPFCLAKCSAEDQEVSYSDVTEMSRMVS